jgi:hypothetical protein
MSETYLEAEFQARGYEVESLKVGAGKCFELKAKDNNGKQVVVYLDPETGDVLESK